MFLTPASPARVPPRSVVDFLCALFPSVFESALKQDRVKPIQLVSGLISAEQGTDARGGSTL